MSYGDNEDGAVRAAQQAQRIADYQLVARLNAGVSGVAAAIAWVVLCTADNVSRWLVAVAFIGTVACAVAVVISAITSMILRGWFNGAA